MAFEFPACPDCKTPKFVIDDTRSGCAVCSKCGLVVQKTVLYEQSEWRNFSDKDGTNKGDPNRVGGVFDPLLSDGANLATFIGGHDSKHRLQKFNQMHNLSPLDRKKFKVSGYINNYGSRMSLPQEVKLMSRDLVNQIIESGEMPGKNVLHLVACVIYISAKMCRSSRPLKELCALMNVRKRDVSRIHSEIQKLKAQSKITIKRPLSNGREFESDAEIYSKKFAQVLELPKPAIVAVKTTARNVKKQSLLESARPETIAACVIWSVMQCKPNDKELQRDPKTIAQVCQISDRNFLNQYRKNLSPKLLDVIPATFASPQEVNQASARA